MSESERDRQRQRISGTQCGGEVDYRERERESSAVKLMKGLVDDIHCVTECIAAVEAYVSIRMLTYADVC